MVYTSHRAKTDIHAELEITAGHRTFSDHIVEMTNQIPHATPQSLVLCPSNVRPKHEPYF